MTREEANFIGAMNMCDEISNEAYKKIMCHCEEQEPIIDEIRAEIEHLHDWAFSREEILRIIDKYKVNKHEPKPNIKALGEDMRICQKSISDEKVLIGFNIAVAICNKHLTESEVKNESLHDESNG